MKLIVKYTEILADNNIISKDDKGIYEYGLEQGILILINLSSTIIIGICFGMVIESIVFMLAYVPLRTYAGGYHSKNQISCYFFSIIMIIVALFVIRGINLFSVVGIMLFVSSFIVIYLFSPVEDSNKLLTESEKLVYRKKTRKILMIELTLLVLISFGQYKIVNSLLIAQVAVGFMILLGKWKNNNCSDL